MCVFRHEGMCPAKGEAKQVKKATKRERARTGGLLHVCG